MTQIDDPFEDAIVENVDEIDDNWRGENDRNSLHSMAPYSGSFPPELANYFIQTYSNEGENVLDPFSGGGTTPLEASLEGRIGMSSDIFEYAYVLSGAKCNPVSREEFERYVDSVFDEANRTETPELETEDLRVFFSEETLDMLQRLRVVQDKREGKKAQLFDALMCGILHGSASYHISVPTKDMFPMGTSYVKNYIEEHDLEKPDADIRECLLSKYDHVFTDFSFNRVLESDIRKSDATDLSFDSGSVDLVVTSPPYLHLIDYAYNNWIRLWWLRADYEKERDSIVKTQDLSKFTKFVRGFLTEIERVLKDDGTAVIISGDVKKTKSNKNDVVINTAGLIAEEAVKSGLTVDRVVNDEYGSTKKTSLAKFSEIRNELEGDDEIERIDRCVVLSS